MCRWMDGQVDAKMDVIEACKRRYINRRAPRSRQTRDNHLVVNGANNHSAN